MLYYLFLNHCHQTPHKKRWPSPWQRRPGVVLDGTCWHSENQEGEARAQLGFLLPLLLRLLCHCPPPSARENMAHFWPRPCSSELFCGNPLRDMPKELHRCPRLNVCQSRQVKPKQRFTDISKNDINGSWRDDFTVKSSMSTPTLRQTGK